MGTLGPSWSSTVFPQVTGTTYHAVACVRNWHRLYHQIHTCCLPRKTRDWPSEGSEGAL